MTSRDSIAPSPARSLFARFKRLWWLKAAGTFVFMWTFFSLYFHIQRSPRFPVTQIPLTWLDRAIPLQTWGWIPYLSLWLYTSLPPALQPNFRSLVYYGVCISAVCGAGLLCFYLWPTAVPEAFYSPQSGFAWMHGIDLAGNACPSLHVASAVFSLLWLQRQLRQVGAGRAWQVMNVLWGIAIVYSTLVTKQHVVWDVVAGIALGGCGALASMVAVRDRNRIFRGTCDELQRF
jgi:hypothetical protein